MIYLWNTKISIYKKSLDWNSFLEVQMFKFPLHRMRMRLGMSFNKLKKIIFIIKIKNMLKISLFFNIKLWIKKRNK